MPIYLRQTFFSITNKIFTKLHQTTFQFNFFPTSIRRRQHPCILLASFANWNAWRVATGYIIEGGYFYTIAVKEAGKCTFIIQDATIKITVIDSEENNKRRAEKARKQKKRKKTVFILVHIFVTVYLMSVFSQANPVRILQVKVATQRYTRQKHKISRDTFMKRRTQVGLGVFFFLSAFLSTQARS